MTGRRTNQGRTQCTARTQAAIASIDVCISNMRIWQSLNVHTSTPTVIWVKRSTPLKRSRSRRIRRRKEEEENKKIKQGGQLIYTLAKSRSRSRNKWPTVVASLTLIACLIVESMQRWFLLLPLPKKKKKNNNNKKETKKASKCSVDSHSKGRNKTVMILFQTLL